MFIDIITNIETDRHRLLRSEEIKAITYNGKQNINIQYYPSEGRKRKNQSLNYPTVQIAKEQYNNIIAQLRG
jgi:hypothetical protein